MFHYDSQRNTDTQLEIQALLEEDVDDNLEHATLEATEDGIEEDLVVLPTPQRRAVWGDPVRTSSGKRSRSDRGHWW